MNEVILIVLLVCGQVDTVIVKHPDKVPVYTHDLKNPGINRDLTKILKNKPIVIKYEEKRGHCA